MAIIDTIKAQCKAQGVSEEYAEKIQKVSNLAEEDEGRVIAAVQNFKENVLPLITNSEEERRKAVEEYEKKYNLKDGKSKESNEQEKGKEDPDMEKLSPEVRAILEQNKKLMEEMNAKLAEVTKKQLSASRIEEVREKMKGRVDEKFIERYASRVNLEAEDLGKEIENQIKAFQADKQDFLNDAVSKGDYRPVNGGSVKTDDKMIESYIENKSKDASEGDFAGIKI